jgi:hypothetical protein
VKKQVKKAAKKDTRAVTLLNRIEGLLSDALDECASIEKSVEKNVRALLRTAESSIAAARDYFVAPAKAVRKPAKKVIVKAAPKAKARVTAKKRPVAAKKHAPAKIAVAKRHPEVIAPATFVPPPPPATPPIITAH